MKVTMKWPQIRGKIEFGLFKYDRETLLRGIRPGPEVRYLGYKRIPIRQLFYEFVPPDAMKLHAITKGGTWKPRLSGNFVAVFLLDGDPIGLIPSVMHLSRFDTATIARQDQP